MSKPKLFLMGFMGSGKTTISRYLSQEFKVDFLDTDQEIERQADKKIGSIFKDDGESYFRKLELELSKTLHNYPQVIISTGGGFFMQENVSKVCQSIGCIIYLETSLESVTARLADDSSRPLAKETPLLTQLYNNRLKHYERLASYTVNTDNKSIDTISTLVWNYYENYSFKL